MPLLRHFVAAEQAFVVLEFPERALAEDAVLQVFVVVESPELDQQLPVHALVVVVVPVSVGVAVLAVSRRAQDAVLRLFSTLY